jgi:hypothetical protein
VRAVRYRLPGGSPTYSTANSLVYDELRGRLAERGFHASKYDSPELAAQLSVAPGRAAGASVLGLCKRFFFDAGAT